MGEDTFQVWPSTAAQPLQRNPCGAQRGQLPDGVR